MANSIEICKLAVIWTALASVLVIDPSTGQSPSDVAILPTVSSSGPVVTQSQPVSITPSLEFMLTSMDMLMPETMTSSLPVMQQSSALSQQPSFSTNNIVPTETPSATTSSLPSPQPTNTPVVSAVMSSSVPPPPPSSVPPSPSPSAMGTMLPTSTPVSTTDSPTTNPTMSTGGLSMGAIIGIAAGGGGALVLVILCLLFCCCCYCCCRASSKEEYTVRPYGNVVVRKWDPRTQHGRPESLGESIRSNGRHSFARSSISSVGSFLRASIRRLSGKRRSGKRTSRTVVEDEVTMKVTPL